MLLQLICWSLCIIWNRRKNNLDICSAILTSSIILLKKKNPKGYSDIFVIDEISLLASDMLGKFRETFA